MAVDKIFRTDVNWAGSGNARTTTRTVKPHPRQRVYRYSQPSSCSIGPISSVVEKQHGPEWDGEMTRWGYAFKGGFVSVHSTLVGMRGSLRGVGGWTEDPSRTGP